ncbi:MAG: hypothetical protein V3W04_10580 [Gammaproteobacteria bacterium]
MLNKKILITGLLLVLLTSCASIERFEHSMDSYIGMELKQLQNLFGFNYIERSLEDGQKAYTWVRIYRGSYPGYWQPDVISRHRSRDGETHVHVTPGYRFPAEYYERSCEFTFIVNEKNKALSWRAHGDGCSAYTVNPRVYHSTTIQPGDK